MSKSKAIVDWKAALATDAKALAKASKPDSQNISLKGGRMSLGGEFINDGLQCVVLDATLIRSYYKEAYQDGVIQAPECFALGNTASSMVPHENVPNPQNDKCVGCPLAEFGTAAQGKGPACKTRARLALIPVSDVTTAADIQEAEMATVSLPPTSVKAWKEYCGKLGDGGLAPWAVKTVFTFEGTPAKPWGMAAFVAKSPLGEDDLMAASYSRTDEASSTVGRPYTYEDDDAVPADTSRYT